MPKPKDKYQLATYEAKLAIRQHKRAMNTAWLTHAKIIESYERLYGLGIDISRIEREEDFNSILMLSLGQRSALDELKKGHF